MKILVIGGTSFIGFFVVHQLSAIGHEVTVFNRGQTQADLPLGVKHIQGDRRHLADLRSDFVRLAPQVVLDMILYTEQDALTMANTFREIVPWVVVVRTYALTETRKCEFRAEVLALRSRGQES